MLIGEILSVAIGALRANKLRSFLTMLGIVIGVGAVIAMVALGNGASAAVKDRIAGLGTTLLTVSPGQAFGAGGVRQTDQTKMTVADANAIIERAQHVTAVQPQMQRTLQVQYLTKNTNTSIVGTSANFLDVRKFKLSSGKMFTESDDAARRRVAVLGPTVLEGLGILTPEAIVGEKIKIRGIEFDVIGTLETKGQGGGFGNPDDQILIPLQTARYRVFGSERLNSVSVIAASEAEIPDAMAEIEKVMKRQHRIRAGKENDFQIRNQSDFLTTLNETTQVFTLLLAGIATVSLLVGGIGIMNIMLVSVTERTREIGIRKALGATKINILLQFLIEAVVLCILGGIVGILLGTGGALALNKIFQWNTAIAPESVVVAFAFSAAVGLVFGVWPARRASSLDPIQALRYE